MDAVDKLCRPWVSTASMDARPLLPIKIVIRMRFNGFRAVVEAERRPLGVCVFWRPLLDRSTGTNLTPHRRLNPSQTHTAGRLLWAAGGRAGKPPHRGACGRAGVSNSTNHYSGPYARTARKQAAVPTKRHPIFGHGRRRPTGADRATDRHS